MDGSHAVEIVREADDVCLSGDQLSSCPALAYAITKSNVHLLGSKSTGGMWMDMPDTYT